MSVHDLITLLLCARQEEPEIQIHLCRSCKKTLQLQIPDIQNEARIVINADGELRIQVEDETNGSEEDHLSTTCS